MPLEGEYVPSPWDRAAKQVDEYEASAGREANDLEGVPVVILTTRGRHSGQLRKAPLMRVERDGHYAVVASMGGAPKHPVWYLNLVADSDVELQDGDTIVEAKARTVEGDERAEWWDAAAAVWPPYNDYQKRTDRLIPVVVLDEVDRRRAPNA